MLKVACPSLDARYKAGSPNSPPRRGAGRPRTPAHSGKTGEGSRGLDSQEGSSQRRLAEISQTAGRELSLITPLSALVSGDQERKGGAGCFGFSSKSHEQRLKRKTGRSFPVPVYGLQTTAQSGRAVSAYAELLLGTKRSSPQRTPKWPLCDYCV